MNEFEGKVVLVTGASAGIGEAAALAFAAAGARTYGLARKPNEKHAQIHWLTADLAKPAEIAAAVAKLVEREPKLDALVNNAGIYRFAPFEASDDAMMRAHFETNVFGLVTLTRSLLPQLIAAKGAIVNVSSSAGQKSGPNQAIYAASKAAVDALTRSLAIELGPKGVRVNAIAPGPTATPGTAALPFPKEVMDGMRAQMTASLPMRRLGEPADVARWIVALASPASTWLTGQVLGVDGGLLAT